MIEVTEWFAELLVLMLAHLLGPSFGSLLRKGVQLFSRLSDSTIHEVIAHSPLIEEIIELTEEIF